MFSPLHIRNKPHEGVTSVRLFLGLVAWLQEIVIGRHVCKTKSCRVQCVVTQENQATWSQQSKILPAIYKVTQRNRLNITFCTGQCRLCYKTSKNKTSKNRTSNFKTSNCKTPNCKTSKVTKGRITKRRITKRRKLQKVEKQGRKLQNVEKG